MERVSSTSTKTNISVEQNVLTTALYQPDFSNLYERRPVDKDFQLDPITSHNIKLLKYIQKWNNFSEQLDLKGQQYELLGNTEHLLPLVNTVIEPPPESNAPPRKSSMFPCPPLKSLSRPKTDNDRIFLNCETLDPSCKRRLLQRSIVISCLYEGLDDCNRHILDTMTDLLDNFLSTISTQMACANLATRSSCDTQTPLDDLVNLQKVLVCSGIGTVRDVVDFQKSNFSDRNHRLSKLSEAAFKDCLSKQDKWKKELLPQTSELTDSPSGFSNRNISEPLTADFNASRRDGSSLKRGADAMGPSSEEDVLGFYGHAEYVSSNPAKKAKI